MERFQFYYLYHLLIIMAHRIRKVLKSKEGREEASSATAV